MYSYCSATLTEVFPCFFLTCKANATVYLAKTGHGPHSSKMFVFFYVLFVLFRSVYCLCANVYCTTATGWQPNCSWQIYHIININIYLIFFTLRRYLSVNTFTFYTAVRLSASIIWFAQVLCIIQISVHYFINNYHSNSLTFIVINTYVL